MKRVFALAGMAWIAVAAAMALEPATETGSAPEEDVVQVLRTTNKAQVNHYVSAALEFKNVNPFNLVNFFWAATSREEGGIYSFVHPDGESGYLVVICPEYQLSWLRSLAQQLDRPKLTSAPGSKYIFYRMRNRNIADPSYRRALSYYAGATGVLIPDVETNSVLIMDAPAGADGFQQALQNTLDLPLRQVDLRVRMYEIDVDNDHQLGLDFEAWKNGPGQILAQYHSISQDLDAEGVDLSSHQHASGMYLNYPSAFFDALVQKGKARTLVETRIAAINRVPAVVSAGEQVLYYDIANGEDGRTVTGTQEPLTAGELAFPTDGRVFSGGNARSPFLPIPVDAPYPLAQYPQQGRPINSRVGCVDAGVTLAIVPTIGDQLIHFDLNFQAVSVTGFDGAGKPLVNSRQLSDSIAVANGAEVVIGGLSRDREIKSVDKIPLLGSLPILGYLFSSETVQTKKSIVAVALTPTLVEKQNNVGEAEQAVARRARGEDVVTLPRSEYCFEQSLEFNY